MPESASACCLVCPEREGENVGIAHAEKDHVCKKTNKGF